MGKQNVILIGAGNIARTHAAALKTIEGLSIAGIYDVNSGAAMSFAKEFGIHNAFASIEEAVAFGADTVHVMTPPQHHLLTALPFVQAGQSVFVEKPVGVSRAECDELRQAAKQSGAAVGVNQNLVFNPAYRQLKETISAGKLGRPRYLSYLYEVPLRQLSARQFGHWMFRDPVNILLEQAVHPLSQIVDLAGRVGELSCLAESPIEISPGVGLHAAMQLSMACERMPAHLRFHVGAQFPVCRMTVVCDDGVAIADVFANQFHTLARTAYMEPVDNFLSARKTAKQIIAAGFSGLRDYSLSMIGMKGRSDQFYLGMRDSIKAFYADLAAGGQPAIDLEFGAHVVEICERAAASFKPLEPATIDSDKSAEIAVPANAPLVAVLGGTGFIGTATVKVLVDQGYRVRVMARSAVNLDAVFYQPAVEVVSGDVKRSSDLERVVVDCDFVVNLAHGGGGKDFEAIRSAMVDSAKAVVAASIKFNVKRLVHVGSISGLFLGQAGEVITGVTPPDPQPETRNDYARAKALADSAVFDAAGDRLAVVVLRPGLVVGKGTSPFHGGLGFFNNDQYCIGWNAGNNPLPWVLVDDCARAIVASLSAPAAVGKAYNLVGDVRYPATDYLCKLAETIERPLHFVPSSPTGLWSVEMGKWLIKRLAGRKVGRPCRRDILSRGLLATFDCSDAKRDLGWTPVSDPAEFDRQAIAVHR